MDFTPSPRLVEIQSRARAFVESVLQPLEVVCDAGDGLPPDVEVRARAAARESGFFAPNMPAEWGGAGLDVLEQVTLEEELGRATNCLWAIMWRPANVLVHCTETQRARYLLPVHPRRVSGLLRGDRAGGGLGHHPARHRGAAGRRRVRHLGREVVRHRRRRRRFFMVVADVVDGARRLPTIFLVDRDAPGFTVGRTPRFTHSVVYSHPELRLERVARRARGRPRRGRARHGAHQGLVPRRAADDRRALPRRRAARSRAGAGVGARAPRVRPAARRAPGRPVDARRLRLRAGHVPRADPPDRLGGARGRRPQGGPRPGVDGEALTRPRWPAG